MLGASIYKIVNMSTSGSQSSCHYAIIHNNSIYSHVLESSVAEERFFYSAIEWNGREKERMIEYNEAFARKIGKVLLVRITMLPYNIDKNNQIVNWLASIVIQIYIIMEVETKNISSY